MCGITAYIGPRQACPDVITALARLQHLGQHSAGIAMLADRGIEVRRALGPCAQLVDLLGRQPLPGCCAIAHTRGATIGAASEENCHPHRSRDGRIAVVHSGEVANHALLRKELEDAGMAFAGSSDSEVIPHLLASLYRPGSPPEAALKVVRTVIGRLEGGNAFAVLFADHPQRIFAARQGSPLFIGRSDASRDDAEAPGAVARGDPVRERRHWWLSSDVFALRGFAEHVCALGDGQVAEISSDALRVSTSAGTVVAAVYRNRNLAAALTAGRLLARRIRQTLQRLARAPRAV
jgi:glucosamine 6-phosphate synthetase-like amidotransferase/phosphosugar isomerase protein